MKVMNMQRTSKSNNYEMFLNNLINEHIDETKRLTSGIEVLKLGKRSSHIGIDNLNEIYGERDQIDKGDKLDKKLANTEELLAGNNEVLKLGIISSQSCIEKYSDERDQRENDIEKMKFVIMSSQSCIEKDYD